MLSRRSLLSGLATTAFAPLLPAFSKSSSSGRSVFRVAHMTDFHVQPELNAPKGMEMALHHALQQKPDLILVGGDCIMDGFSSDADRTALQWKIFKDKMDGIKTPVHYAIGNHDVWGWNKKDSHTTGSEALWGKKWFMDEFGYTDTHHSFDANGWHFVVLDNILLTPDGYNGVVGPEQLEWLDHDLAQAKLPTVVLSHIPILSVTALATGYNTKTGDFTVGGDAMTKDWNSLEATFARNPQVKLVLSGHEHEIDRVDYKGITYLCGGAVCGNWWKGIYNTFEPGYRMLDLHADGTYVEKFHTWGWDKSFLS